MCHTKKILCLLNISVSGTILKDFLLRVGDAKIASIDYENVGGKVFVALGLSGFSVLFVASNTNKCIYRILDLQFH